jgi:hypothetical protein
MTLNEKFDKATDGWIVAHACEQIADDYAIEFSNWLFNIDKEVLKKQLNEFKKEKGL